MDEKMKKRSTEETEKNNNNSKDQSNLDALLYDNDDEFIKDSSSADGKSFESFMTEYRNMMNSTLGANAANEAEKTEEEMESEFLLSLPKSKNQKSSKRRSAPKAEKRDDWDDGITLTPQTYVDPGEEDNVLTEKFEEEEHTPDFNLGESVQDDSEKIQISINFNGEENNNAPEEEEKTNKYNPEKPRVVDWVFDFAEMFVFVLLAVMILTSFVFKHSVVEGDSMRNTLHNGEHLIITDLFYTPESGDIIVFEDYSTALRKPVVKRVIGLPGDIVEVSLNEKKEYIVFVNGTELSEDYALNIVEHDSPGVGVWTVPEDEIFVMGDNRYNSTDSRSPLVGTIKIDSILGKVILRFYPFDKFGKVE